MATLLPPRNLQILKSYKVQTKKQIIITLINNSVFMNCLKVCSKYPPPQIKKIPNTLFFTYMNIKNVAKCYLMAFGLPFQLPHHCNSNYTYCSLFNMYSPPFKSSPAFRNVYLLSFLSYLAKNIHDC